MDQDRQVRLLVAPFFLYAWVVLGAHYSGVDLAAQLKAFESEQLVAIAAILLGSLLPVGFLLATIAIATLRLALLPTGKPYEASCQVMLTAYSGDGFEHRFKRTSDTCSTHR
jgi:hypothetical protein